MWDVLVETDVFLSMCTELKKNPVEGFSAGLEDEDIFKWSVMIMGPPDTL